MNAIYIVLALALVVVLTSVAAFVWAARRGQFDDLSTPPVRMLHDDEPAAGQRTASKAEQDPPRG